MHFIRLIRPINLCIIGATMYGLGWYFESIYGASTKYGISSVPYNLLVFSTLLIAAAGNIINDYFDVKADRINKPERLIIGKYVKRRVAIVSHWGINMTAFSIAIYLSWVLETFWYLFVHLLTINLLWFYSMKLKRMLLIGNILIAALTALVPILVGFYFHQLYNITDSPIVVESYFPFTNELKANYILWLSVGLAGFAFVLNLAREMIKDMEDVEGDKKLNANTLPITIGYKKTKVAAAIVLLFTVVGSLIILSIFQELDLVSLVPIEISAFFVLICFYLLKNAKTKAQYRVINHFIKLSMVAGMMAPIYWNLLFLYG